MDVEKLGEIFREGKGPFAPLALFELDLMHTYDDLSFGSCILQSVEVLPLYILTNVDLFPPSLFSIKIIGL